jgi:hypothetical protein
MYGTASPESLHAKVVEPDDIVPGDLSFDLLRYPLKIAFNILARPRPATLPVGIVIGPHVVVGTHQVRVLEADRVIDEARIHIGLEIRAEWHPGRDRGILVTHAVLIVGEPEEVGHPAESNSASTIFRPGNRSKTP